MLGRHLRRREKRSWIRRVALATTLVVMEQSSRLGLGFVGVWCVLAAGCDTDIHTEHRQVKLSSPDLLPGGTFVSGDMVVEASRVCFELGGYRGSAEEPEEFESASHDELQACYASDLRGPGRLEDEHCVVLQEPGIVDLDLVRRPCPLEGTFGDDRLRFDVVPITAVRAVFDYAVPLPDEVLGWTVVRESPGLPQGVLAAEGEPIYLIEDLAETVRTRTVFGDAFLPVWVTSAWTSATTLGGSPSFEEPDEPSLGIRFEARAGDAFAVRVDLPAGGFDVGDVHVVSRRDVVALELFAEVVRVGDGDAFYSVGAEAVARDRRNRVLREPPVEWVSLDADREIQVSESDDGTPARSPRATIIEPCRGARAGETRSATLEGRLDDHRERVTVQWECREDHTGGCGCTSDPPSRPRAWLLGLVVAGLVRRRRRGRGNGVDRSENFFKTA